MIFLTIAFVRDRLREFRVEAGDRHLAVNMNLSLL